MLRVLHVYKTYYPETYGGIEQVIYQLCEGGAQQNISSDVFTFSPQRDEGPVAWDNHRVIYNKSACEIASTPFSLAAIRRFNKIKDDYDIINYHFPFPFMDLLHLTGRPRGKTVVTYHSDIVKQKNLLQLYNPLKTWFLNNVDSIVASSPNYASSSPVLARYKDKVSVIPFGLSCSNMDNDRQREARWAERVGNKFFLFVGAFRYYKGLPVLLRAAQITGLPVVIVGGGPLEENLRASVARAGLNNITFTGVLGDEDKNALYRLCYGVVFPSHLRSEAFGITLLEGAKFGKPLISCELGTGTSYINLDNQTGYVIPATDPQALAKAMQRLWDDEAQAAQFGKNARLRFEEMFRLEQMVASYIGLYRRLLEQ
ncbi:glycosyltransferase family 4 protein [Entomohabitans teleogrylli]|uniref:glycosyltransferase family 4 protein n=1 Tax=Entomohabitans teleogrylli TaxID=1384589 RepID=UPI000B2914E8|nr:glycosyltransferase family 4 protein [Entomohabitans teleogrylli]